MIKVYGAAVADALEIKPKEFFRKDTELLEKLAEAIDSHPAITLVDQEDENILAIIGFTRIHQFSGEFWAVTSDECDKYPVSFTRKIIKLLRDYVLQHKLRRVQMIVQSDYQQGIIWANRLGFEFEGTLRSFGPNGENCNMMAKVY